MYRHTHTFNECKAELEVQVSVCVATILSNVAFASDHGKFNIKVEM